MSIVPVHLLLSTEAIYTITCFFNPEGIRNIKNKDAFLKSFGDRILMSNIQGFSTRIGKLTSMFDGYLLIKIKAMKIDRFNCYITTPGVDISSSAHVLLYSFHREDITYSFSELFQNLKKHYINSLIRNVNI